MFEFLSDMFQCLERRFRLELGLNLLAYSNFPGCIPCKLHAEGVPGSVYGVPQIAPVQYQPKLKTQEIPFHPVSQTNYSGI